MFKGVRHYDTCHICAVAQMLLDAPLISLGALFRGLCVQTGDVCFVVFCTVASDGPQGPWRPWDPPSPPHRSGTCCNPVTYQHITNLVMDRKSLRHLVHSAAAGFAFFLSVCFVSFFFIVDYFRFCHKSLCSHNLIVIYLKRRRRRRGGAPGDTGLRRFRFSSVMQTLLFLSVKHSLICSNPMLLLSEES